MNLKYTIDANVEEPIMLIEGSIGDKVSGGDFCRELMYLDSLNKKSIKIWINSEGGSVTHGNLIYNAILNIKTDVNTLCLGMAASIACVIFQAGKARQMMSNAFQMMHNPYNPNKNTLSKKDLEILAVLTKSINNSISERSGLSQDDVKIMLDKETYLNADRCLELGLCTEIITGDSVNKKINFENIHSINDLLVVQNKFKDSYKNIINKKNNMDEIKNKLGLSLDTSDENLQKAVLNKIKNLEDIQDKLTSVEAQMNDFKNKLEAEKTAFETYKNEVEKKQLLELTEKANLEVEKLQSQGKIAKEISLDVKNAFVRQFVNNWDEASLMYGSMPINIKGEDLSKFVKNDENEVKTLYTSAPNINEIINKSNVK